jgi:hypothetical protein
MSRKLLHEYIGSLSEALAPAAGGNFFDAATIRKDFEAPRGLTAKKAATGWHGED